MYLLCIKKVLLLTDYCPYCQRTVTPVRPKPAQMSWFAIVVLTVITGGIFLVLYFIARIFTSLIGKAKRCPICNAKL